MVRVFECDVCGIICVNEIQRWWCLVRGDNDDDEAKYENEFVMECLFCVVWCFAWGEQQY